MTTFNYSTLSAFTTCPRRHWLASLAKAAGVDPADLDGEVAPSRALALGGWVHDAIEAAINVKTRTFDGSTAAMTAPSDAAALWLDHESTDATAAATFHADFQSSIARARDAWKALIAGVPPHALIYIERAFYVDSSWRPLSHGNSGDAYDAPPAACAFKSRLDVLIVDERAGVATLADWKTGLRPRLPGITTDPDRQLAVYAAMIFAHWPKLRVVRGTFANLRCLRDPWEPAVELPAPAATIHGREWCEATASEIRAADAAAVDVGEAAFEAVENPFCPCEHAASCPVGRKFMARASESAELTATLIQKRYANDSGWGVWIFDVSASDAAIREHVAVKGEICEPVIGASYRIIGQWETDPRYGRQIKSRTIEIDVTSDAATQRVLDGVKWVGPERARALVAAYGAAALDVLLDESRTDEVLKVAKGIGRSRIADSRAQVRAALHETRVKQTLFAMLPGIHSGVASRLWREYGEEAPAVLRRNPYACLSVHGIGWTTADSLALGMGVAPDSPYRLAAGIDEVYRQAEDDGHTLLPKGELLQRCERLLGVARAAILDAIRSRLATGDLIEHPAHPTTGDRPTVQLAHRDDEEREIAAHLARIYESAEGVDPSAPDYDADAFDATFGDATDGLTDEQAEAVARILRFGAGVITGGPGTGKTHTLLALLKSLPERVRDKGVALAAPTGKAARVMSARADAEAVTIHSLLVPEGGSGPETGWSFKHGLEEPLGVGAVVIDESSMVDAWLLLALLRAIPSGCWLVMIGDADQLPPVGAGDPFRAIVNLEMLPVSRLTVPHRNAGTGAAACAAVIAGRVPEPGSVEIVDGESVANHWILPVRAEHQAAAAIEIINRWGRARGIDPRDAVVLSANSAQRGAASAPALNVELQAALNSGGLETPFMDPRSQVRWRIGDRLVVRKNDRRNTGLVNGSLVWLDRVVVRCSSCDAHTRDGDPPPLREWTAAGTCDACGADLTGGAPLAIVTDESGATHELPQHIAETTHLAYALTTHQYQGSQAAIVVVALDWRRQRMVVNRQWLYTALSRFQRYLFVLTAGGRDVAEAVATPGDNRWTGLGLRVGGEMAVAQ